MVKDLLHTGEVIGGDLSLVFDQAENRLHTAAAVLLALTRGALDSAHAETAKALA